MSKPFRFATVQKLREQTRDERRRELAQAYEAERLLREKTLQMQAEIDATQQRTRQVAGQGQVNVEDLLSARRYELIVKSELKAVESQIVQVLAEIERRRQALLEADREVKVLNKLQERQAEQAAEIERKRENKQLDEAALRGFSHRQEVLP
jgi:flagellar export protein FliJ